MIMNYTIDYFSTFGLFPVAADYSKSLDLMLNILDIIHNSVSDLASIYVDSTAR